MSMSVQDLPESERNAILDGELRKMYRNHVHVVTGPKTFQWSEANDPADWNPRNHPGYAELIDDMAANRRRESEAVIDNIVAITVPDLTALKIAVKTNTSMTNFKDYRLQQYLWIEAMKERLQ